MVKQQKGSRTGRKPRDYFAEAEMLLEWAKKEDSLILRSYATYRDITHEMLLDWQQKSETFRRAYSKARTIVGARRELIVLKQGSNRPYERYAALYDTELAKHEAEIRADNTQAQAQIVLVDKGTLDRAELQQASKIKSKAKCKEGSDA